LVGFIILFLFGWPQNSVLLLRIEFATIFAMITFVAPFSFGGPFQGAQSCNRDSPSASFSLSHALVSITLFEFRGAFICG
jgi:hypothetical protein